MLPRKRQRRSASVPDRTTSESHVHRYFVRRRPNSGLLQPVPIHADVVRRVRPPVVTNPSLTDDVCRNANGQPAFHFTDSGSSHTGGLFTESVLFKRVRAPMPILPLSECKDESVRSSSAALLSWTPVPVVRSERVKANADMASLQPVTRCRSQPGALLSKTSILKRRRHERRPRLDFRKMREVITT